MAKHSPRPSTVLYASVIEATISTSKTHQNNSLLVCVFYVFNLLGLRAQVRACSFLRITYKGKSPVASYTQRLRTPVVQTNEYPLKGGGRTGTFAFMAKGVLEPNWPKIHFDGTISDEHVRRG